MAKEPVDSNTRYFVDLDLASRTILDWGYDNRFRLIREEPLKPSHHRIFLSKGQYNKLDQKHQELQQKRKKY